MLRNGDGLVSLWNQWGGVLFRRREVRMSKWPGRETEDQERKSEGRKSDVGRRPIAQRPFDEFVRVKQKLQSGKSAKK